MSWFRGSPYICHVPGRLGLAPTEFAEVSVAYVKGTKLQAWPQPQRYTYLEKSGRGGLYRFLSLDGGPSPPCRWMPTAWCWIIRAFSGGSSQAEGLPLQDYPLKPHGLRDIKGGKAMTKDASLTGIFVNDQEAARGFYTNKLGQEKVQDEPYGERALWITVSPPESRTTSSCRLPRSTRASSVDLAGG